MTRAWAIFTDDLIFTKKGKKTRCSEKFSIRIEQEKVCEKSAFLVVHKMLKHVAETALFRTVI